MNYAVKSKLICRAIAAYYNAANSVDEAGVVDGLRSAVVTRNDMQYAVLEDANGEAPLAFYRIRQVNEAYMLKRVKKLPKLATDEAPVAEEAKPDYVAMAFADYKSKHGGWPTAEVRNGIHTLETIGDVKYVVIRGRNTWVALYRVDGADVVAVNKISLELEHEINEILVPGWSHMDTPRKYACGCALSL